MLEGDLLVKDRSRSGSWLLRYAIILNLGWYQHHDFSLGQGIVWIVRVILIEPGFLLFKATPCTVADDDTV